MTTTADLIFLCGLTCLIIHELDAIKQAEWRFFFAPFPVSDETAYRIFTALHAPLLVYFWNLGAAWFQAAVDVFLIIHAALHWALRNHRYIQFNNGFSRVWIYGGAVFGLLHLLLR